MEIRHRILGTMFTMTTYGSWLRGDKRGYVEDGRTKLADPMIEAVDRARLKYPPFEFADDAKFAIGDRIGRTLIKRLGLRILALTVQLTHVHFIVAETDVAPAETVKCAKDTVRFLLKPSRPIWTDNYDKRFCTEEAALVGRIAYVEQHNLEEGLPAKPWEFIQ